MSSIRIVQDVLLILVPLLLLCVIGTLARAFLLAYLVRRNEHLAVEARHVLVQVASTPGVDVSAMRKFPFRVNVKALVLMARSVTGPELARVRKAADQLGVVRKAERMCTSWAWWKRLYGARILTVLGSNSEVVPALAHDRHPLVRGQVAEWVATRHDAVRIDTLIGLINDPVAYCRFAAKDALLRVGAPAVPAIAERLKYANGAGAKPLLEVAAGIANPEFLASALRLVRDEDAGTRAAAADVLGAVGGAQSAEHLIDLLNDDVAEVRASAAHALGRIEHWPSAQRLGALLEDPVWEVRTAAASALRMVGAPGELVLRRATHSGDQLASDLAKQALDLAQLERV